MRKFLTPLLFMIVAAIATISIISASINSLTYDEVAHIGAGYSYLKEHDFRLNPEHPPILKVFSALPLLFINPPFPVTTMSSWNTPYTIGEYGQWDAGRLLLHESGNDADKITLWARLPMVIIFVLTGLFIFFWAKKLSSDADLSNYCKSNSGYAAGFLALILWMTNPNILGHNHLITTDVGAAGAFALCLYLFLRFIKLPSYKNAIVLGAVFGLANAIKFSTFILAPFFIVMLILYIALSLKSSYDQPKVSPKQIKNYFTKSLLAGTMTLATLYLIYIPFSFATPVDVLQNIAPLKIHNEQRPIDIWSRDTILGINEVPAIRPLALYFYGLTQVFHRVAGGNNTYFIGSVSPNKADPLYFPTVFTIKEPLLYLLLYLITAGTLIYTLIKISILPSAHVSARSFFLRNFSLCTLILFIFFYSLLAINGNLTIGIRHLFPIYPPIFILCAVTIVTLCKKAYPKNPKKILHPLCATLIAGLLIQAILIFPGYLSFFNVLAGGSLNGYQYVVDSNADWGQSTKRLLTYLKKNNINKINLQYFGGDNIPNRFRNSGIEVTPLLPETRPINPGYYVISTTPLQESIFAEGATRNNSYLWTKKLSPIAQIDSSFLIFYIPEKK